MKRKVPQYDHVTGECRYGGKWWDSYPHEEIEAEEVALDEYWERKQDRRRDKNDDT